MPALIARITIPSGPRTPVNNSSTYRTLVHAVVVFWVLVVAIKLI